MDAVVLFTTLIVGNIRLIKVVNKSLASMQVCAAFDFGDAFLKSRTHTLIAMVKRLLWAIMRRSQF